MQQLTFQLCPFLVPLPNARKFSTPGLFASRQTSKPNDVCALLRRHHSSSAALISPPLVIQHSRSPAPVFETVCHSTLCLHPHCLSSTAASRLTSFGDVSRNIFFSCIVPAHFRHYNRLLYCITTPDAGRLMAVGQYCVRVLLKYSCDNDIARYRWYRSIPDTRYRYHPNPSLSTHKTARL